MGTWIEARRRGPDRVARAKFAANSRSWKVKALAAAEPITAREACQAIHPESPLQSGTEHVSSRPRSGEEHSAQRVAQPLSRARRETRSPYPNRATRTAPVSSARRGHTHLVEASG